MTTWQMNRCKHCPYLRKEKYDEWICDFCEEEIHEIPDSECRLEKVQWDDIMEEYKTQLL